MSLFGGDGTASQTQSPYESESDLGFGNASSPIERPPVATLSGIQSAQTIVPLGDAGLGTDSESESEDAEDEESPARPNRFPGPPQSWKSYTAADRQIATSLNQLEETDLAAHLYNAHALKRRVRRPARDVAELHNWQSKDVWLKKGKELQYADPVGQIQTELIPSKDWTAWPLPPAQLFTQHDKLRRTTVGQEDGQWFIDGTSAQDPGQDLREETLGLFLRLAKDNWQSKTSQNGAQEARNRVTNPRARSRSKSVQSMRSQTDVKMKDKDDSETDHQEEDQHTGTRRGRKPQSQTYTRPVVLADDAKAFAISQPTINSLLEQLDDVAMAIRRTRLNHFKRGGASSDMSSQSEFTSDAESIGPCSRSSSRQGNSSTRKRASRPSSRSSSKAKQTAQKTSDHQASLQDSDSASEYEEPLATLPKSQTGRKRSRSESTADEDDISSARDWSGRAGLMDWSEVLGIAAIKGWDERAIARTAQRCAALFGESMSFATFNESLATKPSTEPVHYTPTTVPAPRTHGIISKLRKRPLFQVGTLRCPHEDCYGNDKEFALPYRVVEHCMRVHGYDPRLNDSDNEERTIGGVHVDGFLQPITAKQGWLGHGRSKTGGKKRKTQQIEQSEVDVTGASPDINEDEQMQI
jgi:hypothetical protein